MTHPSKLTLRLDSGLIEGAKAFAQEHERLVSQRSVSLHSGNRALEPRPITRSIVEALKESTLQKIKAGKQPAVASPTWRLF
jgi:hypothetical protein